jgi:hypothetical protein
VDSTIFPALEALKRNFFGSHPDDPIVLHRKELVNKKPPFEALQDSATEAAFNRELLTLFQTWDYVVLTVVIDKLEHQQRYRTWRFDPYQYGLTDMVERYVLWLAQQDAQGDVMSESRGGREDRRLKDSFERVCQEGSDFVPPDRFQARLTSRQLKVKSKANNIAGLQLADLMAHASFRATLARHEGQPLAANFGGRIAAIMEASKYHRDAAGVIEGWGRKWLP